MKTVFWGARHPTCHLPPAACHDAARAKRCGWAVTFFGLFLCVAEFYVQNAWAATGCTGSDIFTNVYNGGAGGGGDLVASATGSQSVVAIFSGVLQFFQGTVEQVMTQMYCSFQSALIGPLNIAITLLVIVFGIMIATGMSPFSVKEAGVILFKIALVWAFATNADWGIGIGYRFFMGVAQEGSDIVLSAICGGNTPTLTQPDSLISSFAGLLDGTGVLGAPPEGCLDNGLTWPAINPACGNYFMIAAGLMLFLSPSILSFASILVIEYLTLYVRALVGYLASLVFITFLFILSPLFISFALFRTTFYLFTKWLQFLTAFSLQMVLVFAFLAMITAVSGQLIGAFFQFMALFQPYDITMGSFETHMPMTVCSICEGSVGAGTGGGMPSFQCGSGGATNDGVQGSSGSQVIPLTSLYLHQDLVAFLVAQTVAWWLVAYVLGEFMKKAPEYARRLAGAPMSMSGSEIPFNKPSGAASAINPPGIHALNKAAKNAANAIGNSPWTRRAGLGLMAAGALGIANSSRNPANASGFRAAKPPAPTGAPKPPPPSSPAPKDNAAKPGRSRNVALAMADEANKEGQRQWQGAPLEAKAQSVQALIDTCLHALNFGSSTKMLLSEERRTALLHELRGLNGLPHHYMQAENSEDMNVLAIRISGIYKEMFGHI